MDRVRRLASAQFVRYVLASLGALAVDMGAYLALIATPLWAGSAAAIAYMAGAVAGWVLLSRAVFAAGAEPSGIRRTRQKAVYLLSVGAGLALTTAIVACADRIGADLVLAKGIAVGASFLLTYILRKAIVFRRFGYRG